MILCCVVGGGRVWLTVWAGSWCLSVGNVCALTAFLLFCAFTPVHVDSLLFFDRWWRRVAYFGLGTWPDAVCIHVSPFTPPGRCMSACGMTEDEGSCVGRFSVGDLLVELLVSPCLCVVSGCAHGHARSICLPCSGHNYPTNLARWMDIFIMIFVRRQHALLGSTGGTSRFMSSDCRNGSRHDKAK